MIEDAELLRRYANDQSEPAFAELVQRRVNLVYSVALRQTGNDAHLAQDVTQRVFTDLARKAKQLTTHTALSGWLYRSTQLAAIEMLRAERRRRVREQEAHLMNDDVSAEVPIDGEKIRPLLDQVLSELEEDDRNALALRFFEERSFAEIGAAFRFTEDAARKRVNRALDKLHGRLAQRGVTSTTAALGLALAGQGIVAAPAGLAASVSGAALVAVAGGGGVAAATGVFLTMSKIKVGMVSAIVLAGVATTVLDVRAFQALEAEFKGGRANAEDFARLRNESSRLTAELARVSGKNPAAEELVRVRNRIAALKIKPDDVDESRTKPASTLRNAGWETVDDAFETLLWAQVQDTPVFLDTFAQSYELDRASKPKADAIFAGLSAEAKARFGSAERLFVQPYFGMRNNEAAADPIVTYQILGKQNHEGDPDEVIVRWWQQSGSGKSFEGRTILTRGDNGWKQRRKTPLTDENWLKIAVQVHPVTGELLPETKQP